MPLRQTHTYVTMAVSKATYNEIKEKLLAAGYNHAIHCEESPDTEFLDMHGLALEIDHGQV